MTDNTTIAAELDEEAARRVCNTAMMPASLAREAAALIRSQAARIAELEAMTQWRPISEAPRDMTPILAIQVGTHPITHEPFKASTVVIDDDQAQVFCNSDEDEWSSLSDWNLSHWMPLPPPPKEPA